MTEDEIQDRIKNDLPLPAGLTSVGGNLDLYGYSHPLPAGLTCMGATLNLTKYRHPLPAGLTYVGGIILLTHYDYPLPERLTNVGGLYCLHEYQQPLPERLTKFNGGVDLSGYRHPLPAALTRVGGAIMLRDYHHPLPAGLTTVGGNLYLCDYEQPLPAGLTSVGGSLNLIHYNHPLPEGLTSVEGSIDLRGYNHPLPARLTSVRGDIFGLENYDHPLPDGLSVSNPLRVHGGLIPSTKDQTQAQVYNKLLEVIKLHNLDRANHIPIFYTNIKRPEAHAYALYPSLFAPLSDELCIPVSSLAWTVSDALKPGRVYTSEQRADCLIEEVSIASLHALAEIYPSRYVLSAYLSDVIKKRLGKMKRAAKKGEGARHHHNSR